MVGSWHEVADEAGHGSGSDPVDRVLRSIPGVRRFRSDGGLAALLLRCEAVAAAEGLVLKLDDEDADFRAIAILTGWPNEHEVMDLMSLCDAVALPESENTADLAHLSACGRLSIRHTGDPLATLRVYCRRSVDVQTLTRGAPRRIEEPDGNLDSREKWFQKRHGG